MPYSVQPLARNTQQRPAQQGQGIVEYAGSIVMASFTLAMMMGLGPKMMAPLFSTILASVQSFFSNHLPT